MLLYCIVIVVVVISVDGKKYDCTVSIDDASGECF